MPIEYVKEELVHTSKTSKLAGAGRQRRNVNYGLVESNYPIGATPQSQAKEGSLAPGKGVTVGARLLLLNLISVWQQGTPRPCGIVRFTHVNRTRRRKCAAW
jgi:hypothetical protein